MCDKARLVEIIDESDGELGPVPMEAETEEAAGTEVSSAVGFTTIEAAATPPDVPAAVVDLTADRDL